MQCLGLQTEFGRMFGLDMFSIEIYVCRSVVAPRLIVVAMFAVFRLTPFDVCCHVPLLRIQYGLGVNIHGHVLALGRTY